MNETEKREKRRPAWRAVAVVGTLAAAASLDACSSSSNGAAAADGGSPDAATRADAAAEDTTIDSPAAVATADASDTAVDADGSSDAGTPGCPTDGGVPDDLFCTGLYSDWATKTIAADAIAYTPALVFWSDGAVKSRWMYLPAGSSIDTTDMDNWVFPVGTKIWKQFALNGPIVETRLIWKTAQSWAFLDYRWSADGSSARRFDDGETNVNGTTYEIPSTEVCFRCHAGRRDSVLGVDLIGLGAPGAQGVTLATLAAQGRFTRAPTSLTLTIPEDATQKGAAALGFLHVNCGSSCHNTGGAATASRLYVKLLASEIDPPDGGAAKLSQLQAYTTTFGVMATLKPDGASYLRIAPGDSAHSLVPLLASSRDKDAGGFEPMPPLVSHVPDNAGVALVNAWIDALGDAGGP